MLPTLLQLAGCHLASPPPADPRPAVADISSAFDELVDRLHAGDPAAPEAWGVAHARFEDAVEPALRAKLDPVEVAKTEYGFARVRRAVLDGRDPSEAIDALVKRLETEVADPRQVASR